MPANPNLTCPSCDFDKARSGKAVAMEGDRYRCLDCGSTWRELGGGTATVSKALPLRNLAPETHAETGFTGQELFTGTPRSGSFSLRMIAGGATFMVGAAAAILLLITGLFHFSGWGFQGPDATQISGVELMRQKNASGAQVFRVRGNLENPTRSSVAMPRILITLRTANGEEIVEWLHNTPVHELGAKSKVQFVSAIQHDNPLAAYAEARFLD